MSTPKKDPDRVRIVVEGDASRLSALLPGLQLYDATEITLRWRGGEATLRGEYVALSGRKQARGERRLRLTFEGAPGNVSRPARTTPAYGVPVVEEEFCGMETLDPDGDATRSGPAPSSAPPRRAT